MAIDSSGHFHEMDAPCRLCLSKSDKFIRILTDDTRHIKHKLVALIPIEVWSAKKTIYSTQRNHPILFQLSDAEWAASTICQLCSDKIENFYDYFNRVLANQSYFTADHNKTGDESMQQKISYSIGPIIDDAIDLIGNDSTYQVHIAGGGGGVEIDPIDNDEIDGDTKKWPGKKENSSAALPEHLRIRMTKARGDAQIREFVSLVCDLCGDGGSKHKQIEHRSFKDLQIHFLDEHQQRGYIVCCDKRFYRKDRLMSHITNHINPDAFKCALFHLKIDLLKQITFLQMSTLRPKSKE